MIAPMTETPLDTTDSVEEEYTEFLTDSSHVISIQQIGNEQVICEVTEVPSSQIQSVTSDMNSEFSELTPDIQALTSELQSEDCIGNEMLNMEQGMQKFTCFLR